MFCINFFVVKHPYCSMNMYTETWGCPITPARKFEGPHIFAPEVGHLKLVESLNPFSEESPIIFQITCSYNNTAFIYFASSFRSKKDDKFFLSHPV